MGYVIEIGEAEAQPLASTTGWGDVIRWVTTLPDGKFMELRHLTEYGWNQELPTLEAELKSAWETHPSKQDGLSETVLNLIKLLEDREESAVVCTVSDGCGEKPTPDEEE